MERISVRSPRKRKIKGVPTELKIPIRHPSLADLSKAQENGRLLEEGMKLRQEWHRRLTVLKHHYNAADIQGESIDRLLFKIANDWIPGFYWQSHHLPKGRPQQERKKFYNLIAAVERIRAERAGCSISEACAIISKTGKYAPEFKGHNKRTLENHHSRHRAAYVAYIELERYLDELYSFTSSPS